MFTLAPPEAHVVEKPVIPVIPVSPITGITGITGPARIWASGATKQNTETDPPSQEEPMPALTVHNAEIKTATVEIKTLTISRRQVTQAVFRQLQEEPLVADDGTLNGVPWGRVNYHPDKCGDAEHHLHVVWQLGTELRRCRVDQPAWWKERFYGEASDGFVQGAYCLNGHERPEWVESARARADGAYYDCLAFRFDEMHCETLDDRLKEPRYTYSTGERRRAENDSHQCWTEEEFTRAREWMRQEVAEEKARRERIKGHWRALNDLPQLFIAV